MEFEISRLAGGAAVVFAALLALRLMTGSRPVAQLNSVSLVTLIAFGVAVSAVLVWQPLGVAEGAVALGALLLVFYLSDKQSPREIVSGGIGRSQPALLATRGRLLRDALTTSGISQEVIWHAFEINGYSGVEDLEAVVLGADGSLILIDHAGNVRISPVQKPAPAMRSEKEGGGR